MSPAIRSLFRKEWSERHRIFLLGMMILLVFLGYNIAYELEYQTRALVAAFYTTAFTLGGVSAVLLAMSTVSGEFSQRTITFSQSLPVRLSTVAWVRLLGAWGCLVVPIVVGAIIVTVTLALGIVEQAGLRSIMTRLPDRPNLSKVEAIEFLWTVTLLAVTTVIHFVTLISLLGIRCRSEGSVGLLGAVCFLCILAMTTIRPELEKHQLFLIADWIGALVPQSMAINWGYGEIDGSSYSDLELAPLILGPVVINILITLLLATWFTRLYGYKSRAAVRETTSVSRRMPRIKLPALLPRFPFRFPNRVAALIWLDARQSVPLSLAGLLLAVVITFVGMGESSVQSDLPFLMRMAAELPSTTWIVGGIWGVIVAVAIFSSELMPGLEQFWRSRPIKSESWFWTKFVVGLLAVLITLDMIPFMIAMGTPPGRSERMGLAYLACIPLIHIVMYATSVAAISRIRRPVPAAIAALLFFYAFDSVLMSIPSSQKLSTLDVYNRLHAMERDGTPVDLMSDGYPVVYGLVSIVAIGATLLANRNLIPPRSLCRRLTTVLVLSVCSLFSPANVVGADPRLMDVVEGIRKRQEMVHDMKMRVSIDIQQTGEVEFSHISNRRPTPKVTSTDVNRNVHQDYALFERTPRRAWSELDSAGQAISTVTFDGSIQSQYTTGLPRNAYRSMNANSAATPPFQRPDSLMVIGGTDLISLLEQASSLAIQTHVESGEEFVELSFTNPAINAAPDIPPVFAASTYRVKINTTRHYWPVKLQFENVGADGTPQSRFEMDAEGWIDAGPLTYPRKITSRSFQLSNSNRKNEELELINTIVSEVTEVAVNTAISDDAFVLKFPPGAIFYDASQRKHYEVGSDGDEHAYIPTPKGIRGAVMTYQFCVFAAVVVYLFRRKTAV